MRSTNYRGPLCALYYFLTTPILFALACLLPHSVKAEFHPIELLSSPNGGGQSNDSSFLPSLALSGSGRFIVFESNASNLISNDTNSSSDIFLYDRNASEGARISRVSVDSDELEGNGDSSAASVSSDGRFIVFQSDATNLIADDTNGVTDIFLRDTQTGTTSRVSIDTDGVEANGASTKARISSDGNWIVFESKASNLVNNDLNSASDIFRHNRVSGETIRVSVDSSNNEGDAASSLPTISSDGTLVAFESLATNFSVDDQNGIQNIFLRDIQGGTTTLVSRGLDNVPSNGTSLEPYLSDDGTLVAFTSSASNLVVTDTNATSDIFLFDIQAETTALLSSAFGDSGDGSSSGPSISGDNSYVVFQSEAKNLVVDDLNDSVDIFAYSFDDETLARISISPIGVESAANSRSASINSTGQFIAYQTSDDALVSTDTNALDDILLVNTQCLLTPSGVVAGDEDGDSTDDCSDECPLDPLKTVPGECGCGTVETDSDGDGTPDCNDLCPNDDTKTTPGVCGCGKSDADGNSNGSPDCLEFNEDTIPRKPVAFFVKERGVLRVIIPDTLPGYRYQIQVRQNGKLIRRARTTKSRNGIRLPQTRGVVTVRYRVILNPGPGFSKFSPNKRVRI